MALFTRPRFQQAVKALTLLGLALFLYTRLADGTLFFYINQRFLAYTVFAVVAALLIAASYRPGAAQPAAHSHANLTLGGLFWVLLPIGLGLLFPPQPLGAAALGNRELTLIPSQRSVLPAAVRTAAEKSAAERTVLDWLHAFSASSDPAQEFAGQPVDVVGFVYHDPRLPEGKLLVNRFTVSCCVADASPVSLVVQWADAATLANDSWVQVQGVLQPGAFNGRPLPIVMARRVDRVEQPAQPYLYP
ncbi:MAG: TIGR03943 family protein [Caldilinea sp.]|jgi:uncharacterized repeat protein (TIGR03943 family)|nr:TIGR03943 family protein [Caldilinea sp.]